MEDDKTIPLDLPDTERRNFMVLETHDQKESLYHPIRLEILRALNLGIEDFKIEMKTKERTLEDGTRIKEEVTIRTPSQRMWMSVHEVLASIKENKPKLKISNFNCYYHLRKLHEQGFVEQYPPPKKGSKGDSKRVRGMYFRTTAKFFVPTTFEISHGLTERDVLPPHVTEKAVELAQQVKESGRADAYEYNLKIGKSTYWFSVTMSLHDDGESIVSVVRDITTQKHIEEELRRSQERLELALRGADLAPWDYDHTSNTQTYSKRFADMLGYTLEEINTFAHNWEDLVHPDDRELVLKRMEDHLEQKTPMFSSEHRVMRKDGRIVWVLDRGRVVERAEDGTPLRSAGTLLDVTHEKIMLEALDRSEERYRRLFEESLQGIVILIEGRIVFANKAYAETVGRSIGELLEMSADETWNLVHPDDRSELEKRNKQIASGEERLPRMRFRYIQPNGQVRWVESYVVVVEHDGKQAIQALEVDITEQYKVEKALQESEKKFREIFELSPIAILLFDSEGVVTFVNEAAKKMFGVSHPSDYASFRLESDSFIPEYVFELVRKGEVVTHEVSYDLKDARFRTKRTGMIHLHVISSAIREEDGTVSTFVGQVIDETEKYTSLKVLKEDEEKYRMLFETSEEAMIIFKNNLIVDCNPVVLEIFNCKKEQLLGNSLWQISPRNQSDKQSSKAMSEQLMLEVQKGDTQELRWIFKIHDGERFATNLELKHIPIGIDFYVRAVITKITNS